MCNDSGYWNYSGQIVNTSGYTMGQASFVFTSPAGLGIFNQTIVFPGGLPSGSSYPFNLMLDVPGMSGDTVCFTVALHQVNDNAQHIHCCNFYDCLMLPECAVEENCFCDAAFEEAGHQGINCNILLSPPHTATFSPGGMLASCDQVVWTWSDTPQQDTTYGNTVISHTFPGFGTFKLCMTVHRTDAVNGTVCEFKICKKIEFPPTSVPGPTSVDLSPNPSRGSFTIQSSAPWPALVQFRVLNTYGQLLRDWEIRNAGGDYQIPVDLPGLEPGVYLLEVKTDGKRWVKKVVVQ